MTMKTRRQIPEIQEKVLIYLRLQRYKSAEDLLTSAIEEHGPLANLLNLMGIVHHRQSQFPQAIDFFERARSNNPEFIEAAYNLAATMADLGFYEQAELIFNESQAVLQASKTVPDLILGRIANNHNRTALCYEQAALLQEACKEYARALEVYPRMPDIRLKLAKLYFRLGQFQDGKNQLLKLLEEYPDHIESLNLLGAICYKKGDVEEAMRYWKKATDASPLDKTSRTYLRATRQILDLPTTGPV